MHKNWWAIEDICQVDCRNLSSYLLLNNLFIRNVYFEIFLFVISCMTGELSSPIYPETSTWSLKRSFKSAIIFKFLLEESSKLPNNFFPSQNAWPSLCTKEYEIHL